MAQRTIAQYLGLRDFGTPDSSAVAINTANYRLMFGVIPQDDLTLNNVQIYVSGVTGTLGANDLVCEVWSMPTGAVGVSTAPSTMLDDTNVVTATPTGFGVVEFTGLSVALTAGTMYAIVLRNANATPGSNFITVRWVTGGPTQVIGFSSAYGWIKRHSTDGGSTYTSSVSSVAGVRLEFSDGSFTGLPFIQGGAMAAGTAVYSSREVGAKFTTPPDTKIRVKGVGAKIGTNGTPTGQPRFRLYQGTSLVDTTAAAPQWANAAYLVLPFSTTLVLNASTEYRVVLSETTQSDTSTNRFVLYEFTLMDDADSKALMAFGGWVRTYWDGSSWTDADTSAPALYFYLDSDDLFDATAGGGGGLAAPIFGGLVVR